MHANTYSRQHSWQPSARQNYTGAAGLESAAQAGADLLSRVFTARHTGTQQCRLWSNVAGSTLLVHSRVASRLQPGHGGGMQRHRLLEWHAQPTGARGRVVGVHDGQLRGGHAHPKGAEGEVVEVQGRGLALQATQQRQDRDRRGRALCAGQATR